MNEITVPIGMFSLVVALVAIVFTLFGMSLVLGVLELVDEDCDFEGTE